ncbi:MAG: hypothetical protein C4K60_02620 [Ideonella sp. MAG2]|nr:MAG: hypothetical protein C4K60_02620 [Ideonella sp. MAG2]
MQQGQAEWQQAWDVNWTSTKLSHQTRYTVLAWDDIVRQHWHKDLWSALGAYWRYYVGGTQQGLFGRVWPVAKDTWLLGLFPLMICFGVAAVCGGLAGLLAWWTPSWSVWYWAAAPVLWLLAWRQLETRLDSEWLVRLYGFSHLQAAGRVPALDTRVGLMAKAVVSAAEQARASPEQACQEILLVGHSTGSIVAASVLARALELAPWLGHEGPRLSFLTLGHCTPAVAFFDSARAFRRDLAQVVGHSALTWLDYSAPGDWAAFHRVGPWLCTGAATTWQGSPRFHAIMDDSSFAALRRNRLSMHMQYLRATTRPGAYDYVRLSAGPWRLDEHLQNHHPGKAAADAAVGDGHVSA